VKIDPISVKNTLQSLLRKEKEAGEKENKETSPPRRVGVQSLSFPKWKNSIERRLNFRSAVGGTLPKEKEEKIPPPSKAMGKKT